MIEPKYKDLLCRVGIRDSESDSFANFIVTRLRHGIALQDSIHGDAHPLKSRFSACINLLGIDVSDLCRESGLVDLDKSITALTLGLSRIKDVESKATVLIHLFGVEHGAMMYTVLEHVRQTESAR